MARSEQIEKAARALVVEARNLGRDSEEAEWCDFRKATNVLAGYLDAPPDPAPGMEEIERMVGVLASWAFRNGHSGFNHPQFDAARTALLSAIRALAAPGPDRYAEGWREGVLAAREYLRQVWDDGEQGNGDDAAELVLLTRLADGPVPEPAPACEKEGR